MLTNIKGHAIIKPYRAKNGRKQKDLKKIKKVVDKRK